MNELQRVRLHRVWASLAAAVALGIAGCGGDSDSPAAAPPPSSGSAATTVADTVVDAQGVGLAGLTVTLSGALAPASTDPQGRFSLQASAGAQTLTIADGSNVLLTQAVNVSAAGVIDAYPASIPVTPPAGRVTLKDTASQPLPPLTVSPSTPFGGQPVTVNFAPTGASNIAVAFTGAGCGSLTGGSGRASYRQTATAGAGGTCVVQASVTPASGAAYVTTTQFTVIPTAVALPAVSVAGGEFLPGDAMSTPTTANGATPVINAITAPGTVINGGTARLLIDASATGIASIRRVEVAIAGVDGHFTALPAVDGNTGKLFVDVKLDQDFFTASPAGALAHVAGASTHDPLDNRKTARGRIGAMALGTSQLGVSIELVDLNGNVSAAFAQSLATQQVGAGTLQFSLSWDTLTDVDLHVVEPAGNDIYWGAKSSARGGVLDLDSNAACRIDGVNNENVTWSTNTPAAGTYIARVDYWEACGEQPANYVLTINNCGQVSTYTGAFASGDADEGSSGAGRTVASVEFTPCSTARVTGRATYEDYAQTPTGLATSPQALPIRYAKVEVHRTSDDAVLTTGDTDGDGRFDLSFTNGGTPGYYVLVKAEQSNVTVDETVVDDTSAIYGKKSAGYDETVLRENLDIAIAATRADGSAPAFNIFDVGVLGASVVRSRFGVTPPKLTWLWTSGSPGTCSGGTVSCYMRATDTISVLSTAADSDEYDDLVLLHEFGHFVQYHYSADDSPGGAHSLTGRYDPRLAWSEGSATFFGNWARGTSLYIDTNATSAFTFDIETPSANVPLGTSDGTQTGLLSEALVSAILWDLADGANESPGGATAPRDTVANPDGVFSAIAALKSITAADHTARNPVGADLVDFLDQWFCLGTATRGDANTGVQGIVNGMFLFPYDYAAGTCH